MCMLFLSFSSSSLLAHPRSYPPRPRPVTRRRGQRGVRGVLLAHELQGKGDDGNAKGHGRINGKPDPGVQFRVSERENRWACHMHPPGALKDHGAITVLLSSLVRIGRRLVTRM